MKFRDINNFFLKLTWSLRLRKNRRKAQRDAIHVRHQMDPGFSGEEEDTEIAFRPIVWPDVDPSPSTPLPSPGSSDSSAEPQYGVVLDMVQKLNSEMNLITLDNEKIRTVCEKLLYDNKDRGLAMCDLTGLVKRSLDHPSERLTQPDAFKPHPIICPDLIDSDGNLRATDIGQGRQGYRHRSRSLVKVVGPDVAGQPARPQPATSTPYQPVRDHGGCDMSTPRQQPTLPTCLEVPDTCAPLRRTHQENRQGYRPAAPIQRFNNKSLNWPSWCRHFWAVADVHGWDNNQRALQLVSYLDETAMNVVQELGTMNFIIMTFWLNYWETGLTQHLVSRPPGPDSMAGYDVIMRTQIRLLTLSQTYVVSATHRAHRSFVRS